MCQDISWKPGDATKLIRFHQQFAPDIEAARPTPAQVAARVSPDVPALADLLASEANTAAWLRAHGSTEQDARCKGCQVEYLKGELSADGLCHHCADELGEMLPQNSAEAQSLPLATAVYITSLGVNGVISAHNPNDRSRVRVTWFDRHFWVVRHKFFDSEMVQVVESKTASR